MIFVWKNYWASNLILKKNNNLNLMMVTVYFKTLEKCQITVDSERENKPVARWPQVIAG